MQIRTTSRFHTKILITLIIGSLNQAPLVLYDWAELKIDLYFWNFYLYKAFRLSLSNPSSRNFLIFPRKRRILWSKILFKRNQKIFYRFATNFYRGNKIFNQNKTETFQNYYILALKHCTATTTSSSSSHLVKVEGWLEKG